MKKLIFSIVFILVGLFIVDRLGGLAMWWVNQNTQDVSGPKIKYLVNDVDEDVVMMGTSRCNAHYVPSIIADTLGMSAYNGGIDASENIFAHYIMLNHIISHHTPKVICLELMANDYALQPDPYKTISFFAPYFGRNERADSVYRLAGKYWDYKVSHLYRYNAKATSNIVGLFVTKGARGEHGYLPIADPKRYPAALETSQTSTIVDSTKIEYVQRFIDMCREKDIQLVFMVSPLYSKVTPDSYDVLKAIAMRNDVPFLDYHTKGMFLDHPEYFKDKLHLWDKGARLYSSQFAHDLKEVLTQK